MFNRKITPESFDDSLDNLDDYLHDPLATKEFSNKSKPNETLAVDLETGEVLTTPARPSPLKQKQAVDHSNSRPPSKAHLPQKVALTSNLSVLIPIGTSFVFSLIICFIAYFVFSTEFSRLSLEIVQTTSKISDLNQSINRLQGASSSNDEIEEVFDQLENLSSDLENIEDALQNHLQSANKPSVLIPAKKISPSDSLKNISYLGFFGTTDHPVAIITVKGEKKELKTGQFVIDSWQLSTIHSHHITLIHTTGLIQNITRKKPSF